MREFLPLVKKLHYRGINVPAGDIRISIVANCNMRCVYCHNEGQGDFAVRRLSCDQIRTIVEGALAYGVNKVRLTGGEPLLHPDIVGICTMLKEELHIRSVGVNTNGTRLPVLLGLHEKRLLDQIVVGVDHFDGAISKQSPIGLSSAAVRSNVRALRDAEANVQIAMVFDGDVENATRMVRWCLDHDVLLKILEESGDDVAEDTTAEFRSLFSHVIETFGLQIGMTADLGEMFGASEDGRTRVLFFHSHCRVRECGECANMHLRVTAEGRARPCLLRSDTEFDLLHGDFDGNFRRAVHNLGVPPEAPAR